MIQALIRALPIELDETRVRGKYHPGYIFICGLSLQAHFNTHSEQRVGNSFKYHLL